MEKGFIVHFFQHQKINNASEIEGAVVDLHARRPSYVKYMLLMWIHGYLDAGVSREDIVEQVLHYCKRRL